MRNKTAYVVGSGPAGISAAHALLEKGNKVVMLDAGIDLEPEIKGIVSKLKKSSQWPRELVQKIKKGVDVNAKDSPIKLIYGSDYPYRDAKKHIPFTAKGVSFLPSLGKGGLSAVWGAAVLPYYEDDLEGWPISSKELAPHYRKVIGFMGLSGREDDLSAKFPLYSKPKPFNMSRQALSLLDDLNRHKKKLNSNGFIFGSSRLAVNFSDCVYCGLCLYGCPYGLIYDCAFTLEEMKKNKNFTYVKDVIVKRIEEKNDEVLIYAEDRVTGRNKEFKGERIFLGCGPLPTAKIILESMGAYDQPILMKDSLHFWLPFLRFRRIKGASDERLHTLTQMYVELFDKKVSANSVHLQVYTYNDLYEKELRLMFGPLYNLLRKPLKLVLERLVLVQGFVHSNESHKISMSLKSSGILALEKKANKRAKRAMRKIIMKFIRNIGSFRMVPLVMSLKISKPGEGNHYGGSFPMSKNPKKFESDILGRPHGFERTHIVDSSIFPSIPTQTITFNVMANAHRIASSVK